MFARSPYEIAASHSAAVRRCGSRAAGGRHVERPIGMSFWTDASVLGDAGIPSLLFGPIGAGLHGVEEWVDVASVIACRDALVAWRGSWPLRGLLTVVLPVEDDAAQHEATFAGRSPSRRMKYGNHCLPNGT